MSETVFSFLKILSMPILSDGVKEESRTRKESWGVNQIIELTPICWALTHIVSLLKLLDQFCEPFCLEDKGSAVMSKYMRFRRDPQMFVLQKKSFHHFMRIAAPTTFLRSAP